MGDCASCSRTYYGNFQPIITKKLQGLYSRYLEVVTYAKETRLFAERTPRLEKAVSIYLQDSVNFDQENMDLCAVCAVHKLHPRDFNLGTAKKEWLIAACLRQHKFVTEFPYKILNFRTSFHSYIKFLYMCKTYPHEIIVPSLLADFMWHSHMQNPEKYKKNMIEALGKQLNHTDDYSPEELQAHSKRTEQLNKELMEKEKIKLPNTYNQDSGNGVCAAIVVAGGVCGGGCGGATCGGGHCDGHGGHAGCAATGCGGGGGGCGGGGGGCGGGGGGCGGGGGGCGGGGGGCGGGGGGCGGGGCGGGGGGCGGG